MGQVSVEVVITGRRSARVRFVVDTGATYTVIPPALARRIGAVASRHTFSVSLADGRKRRLHACTVGIRVARREGPATALILPGAEPLLGVETLEALGLKVDPSRGRLEPSRALGVMLVGVRLRARTKG